jgi:hypothetical protein
MNVEDNKEFDIDVVSEMMLETFEKTLDPNTNVYQVYILIKNGIRDNPNVNNYIKEIARIWGGCSQQNVVQAIDKLKHRLEKFARENEMKIIDNQFVDLR